jgi:hypothetical protein
MMSLAAVVDTDALLKVAFYSLTGALGLTVVFSLGIVGVAKADDLRREGRSQAAAGYIALAVLSAILVVAGVIEAIVIMTSK